MGKLNVIIYIRLAMQFRRKLRKLAGAMSAGRHRSLQVTMPLPKRLFLRASTAYWTDMGRRGGVTREQMATMEIEGR